MTLRKKAPHASQRWLMLAFTVTSGILLAASAVLARPWVPTPDCSRPGAYPHRPMQTPLSR